MPLYNPSIGPAVAITPIWTSSGTPPSLGNGALVGSVTRLGPGLLLASIKLTFGSTTSAGTGYWTFSLPAPYNGAAAYFSSGNVHFADVGVADYSGTAEMIGGQSVIYAKYGAAAITNGTPFVWGNADFVEFSILLLGP